MTVILMQAGILAAFWFFYRTKQRHWEKTGGGFNDSTMHSTQSSNFSSSPEVIFRSVYDRLSAGGRRPFLIPFPNSQSSSTHCTPNN